MKKLKKSFLFALAWLPAAAVAAYFTILYQLELMDAATVELAVSQLGSVEVLIVIYIVQILGYAAVCGFFGHILAEKVGLMKPIRFEKAAVLRTVAVSLAGGILFSLDCWTFGKWIPEIGATYSGDISLNTWLASVLYGGIVEELMLRLFVMSLLAWVIWKLFFRRRETAPAMAIVAANGIAAVLFAAGHLPATVILLGELTPLILLRCFLLNGGFGVLFGEVYRKYGIQYAMLCHALLHIVSKLIWTVFL